MSSNMRQPPLGWSPFSPKKKRKRIRLCLGHQDGSFALFPGNSVYSAAPWSTTSWLAGGDDRGPWKLHHHLHRLLP